jgi:hypothetical protein
VRYWRTICVDFEEKHRDTGGEDPEWVTRNAKLRTSRKLLFAGGLVPILLCHLREAGRDERFPDAVADRNSFGSACGRLPPPRRHRRGHPHLRRLRPVDAIMQDEHARAELKTLREATRDASELWQGIRAIGEELQRGLNVLLFETALRRLALQYAIF